MYRLHCAIFLLVLLPSLASTQTTAKKQPPPPPPPPTADLTVWVSGEEQAIENAQVYLESKAASYSESAISDRKGKVRFAKVPPGRILLQVTASGWKTSGSEIDLVVGDNTSQVKLERKPPPKETNAGE